MFTFVESIWLIKTVGFNWKMIETSSLLLKSKLKRKETTTLLFINKILEGIQEDHTQNPKVGFLLCKKKMEKE